MVCCSTLWYHRVHYGTLRCQSGTLWYLTVQVYSMVHCGTLWYPVVHHCNQWVPAAHTGVPAPRRFLVTNGTVVSHGTLWYTVVVVHYGTMWYQGRINPLGGP